VYAGADVVSLANNHMWDYGLPALEDTLGYLATNDISAAGAGRTLEEARGPIVRTVGGTRIAYLAYTNILPESALATDVRAGVNLYNAIRMVADIARARTLADIVVVSFHTGTEYEVRHNADQERIYRSAIDAGADLVVGHHPHVVQDTERYKGKWIAYSLGNFVFDQNWSDATRQGMLLDVSVQNGEIVAVATRSVDISKQYQAMLHK
jgi:poly-gamma-glutamate synthesis protein (capsule biosynthesis protein)